MNREQAENLLAALIFDELDDASKAELLAYLQTDDDLREHLADLRMAVKVSTDAVQQDPEPALNPERYQKLVQLTQQQQRGWRRITRIRVLGSVAAVLIMGFVTIAWLGQQSRKPILATLKSEADYADYAIPESAPTDTAVLVNKLSAQKQKRDSKLNGNEFNIQFTGGSQVKISLDEKEVVKNRPATPQQPKTPTPQLQTRKPKSSVSDHEFGYEREGVVDRLSLGADIRPSKPQEKSLSWSEDPYVSNRDSTSARSSSTTAPSTRQELDDDGSKVKFYAGGDVGAVLENLAQEKEKTIIYDPEIKGNVDIDFTDKPTSVESALDEILAEGAPEYTWKKTPNYYLVKKIVDDNKHYSIEPESHPVKLEHRTATEAKRLIHPAFQKYVKINQEDNSVIVTAPSSFADRIVKDLKVLDKKPQQVLLDARVVAPLEQAQEQVFTPPATRVSMPMAVADPNVIEDPTELPPSSRFKVVPVNPWVLSERDALSTFALDVDRASYDLCARYIRAGYRPPIGAVRMEEFVNAFDYNYPLRDEPTFSVYAEAGPSPFAKAGQDVSLLKVAVKARTVGRDQQRPAHLVLVVDTSASMGQPDRLPAVQAALSELVTKLAPQDRVTLVSCSNEARLLLEAVSAQATAKIQTMIGALQASGPTNLLTGLQLGYQMARRVFRAGELNHVVLCSDGVANVGATESETLLQGVAKDRAQGIMITTVGVGYGAYNDTLLESLANQGDGSYLYLDATLKAREAFVTHLCAAMQVVAKDARIQVAFDPQTVRRYRLIGYENRDLEDKRFRDDTVDAGEVGSGQCSTALYEIELHPDVDAQAKLATVFVRYRDMQTNAMQEISQVITKRQIQERTVSESPRFYLAAVVARFAEWLRESEHMMGGGLAEVHRLAQKVRQELPLDKDVQELVELIEKAEHLPKAP